MKYTVKDYLHIKAEVENMSVEELLRAVICPDIRASDEFENHTGAVFIHPTSAEEALSASERINADKSHPTLIASDMECGAGFAIRGATAFPSMRAIALSGKSEYAYEIGVIAAKEAMNAGYHWTFAPCVDILGNAYNPPTANRSAGNDVDDVIEYCGAYMSGLQDTGLIATLKHFPGDGYSHDDQHVTVTHNPLSKEEWDKTYGKIYANLIEKGAMAIMPGHISLAAYDEPDENGNYPPASVSKKMLTDLLRNKLGFEGIIISDATNMSGFCGYMNLYRASCAFLEAGGDSLLFMREDDYFHSEMKKCIEQGYLSIETLKNRAYRMKCFAYEYFEKHPVGKKYDVDRCASDLLAKEVTKNAIRVTRDRVGLLPFAIDKKTKIAHITIANTWSGDYGAPENLVKRLNDFGDTVDAYRDPGPNKLLEIAKSGKYDLMICSVFEGPAWGINTPKLAGPAARNMMCGWMKYDTPVIFVTYNSPAFAKTYEPTVDTVIEAHGYTQYTVDSLIDLIVKK